MKKIYIGFAVDMDRAYDCNTRDGQKIRDDHPKLKERQYHKMIFETGMEKLFQYFKSINAEKGVTWFVNEASFLTTQKFPEILKKCINTGGEIGLHTHFNSALFKSSRFTMKENSVFWETEGIIEPKKRLETFLKKHSDHQKTVNVFKAGNHIRNSAMFDKIVEHGFTIDTTCLIKYIEIRKEHEQYKLLFNDSNIKGNPFLFKTKHGDLFEIPELGSIHPKVIKKYIDKNINPLFIRIQLHPWQAIEADINVNRELNTKTTLLKVIDTCIEYLKTYNLPIEYVNCNEMREIYENAHGKNNITYENINTTVQLNHNLELFKAQLQYQEMSYNDINTVSEFFFPLSEKFQSKLDVFKNKTKNIDFGINIYLTSNANEQLLEIINDYIFENKLHKSITWYIGSNVIKEKMFDKLLKKIMDNGEDIGLLLNTESMVDYKKNIKYLEELKGNKITTVGFDVGYNDKITKKNLDKLMDIGILNYVISNTDKNDGDLSNDTLTSSLTQIQCLNIYDFDSVSNIETYFEKNICHNNPYLVLQLGTDKNFKTSIVSIIKKIQKICEYCSTVNYKTTNEIVRNIERKILKEFELKISGEYKDLFLSDNSTHYKNMIRQNRIFGSNDTYIINYINENFNRHTKCVDLFAGVGQSAMALYKLGFTKVGLLEFDRYRTDLAKRICTDCHFDIKIICDNFLNNQDIFTYDLLFTNNAVATILDNYFDDQVDIYDKFLNGENNKTILLNPERYGTRKINGIAYDIIDKLKEKKHNVYKLDNGFMEITNYRKNKICCNKFSSFFDSFKLINNKNIRNKLVSERNFDMKTIQVIMDDGPKHPSFGVYFKFPMDFMVKYNCSMPLKKYKFKFSVKSSDPCKLKIYTGKQWLTLENELTTEYKLFEINEIFDFNAKSTYRIGLQDINNITRGTIISFNNIIFSDE